MLPENIFEVFARLGFGAYEAKVYATLCACGRLKIRELSKYSDVPQSKIYEVLDGLEKKDAVVISRSPPTTAESVPVKQVVASRVRQYLRDAERIARYVESIQSTELFKHFYHTQRIALRSNGRLSLPTQA